jgi:NADH-quinone oxidoreductase subunit N
MNELVAAYGLIAPEIVLVCGAMALLMLGVFWPENDRTARPSAGSPSATLSGGVARAQPAAGKNVLFDGSFVVDGFARFMKVLTFAASAVALFLSFDYMRETRSQKFEYPVLVLLATAGMGMMISAGDLIALYLGLELQSLALYVVAAIRRDDVRSSEAGLKYFVLGALSSGMLLYGASLIYGFTGSTSFTAIAAAAKASGAGQDIGLIVGLVFLLVGSPSKSRPCRSTCGRPTSTRAHRPRSPPSSPPPQGRRHCPADARDARRLRRRRPAVAAGGGRARHRLHGSWRLRRHRPDQHQAPARLFRHRQHRLCADRPCRRLAGRRPRGDRLHGDLRGHDARRLRLRARHAPPGGMVEDIDELAGLAQTNLAMATVLALLLFSLAGIPPLAGFFAKFYVFVAAVKEGLWGLAVFGVLASVVGAYYYVRIVKIMFFDAPKERFLDVPVKAGLVMGLAGLFMLLYVVWPAPLVDSAGAAARTLF